MSAYALPGRFFFPSSSFVERVNASVCNKKEKNLKSNSLSSFCPSVEKIGALREGITDASTVTSSSSNDSTASLQEDTIEPSKKALEKSPSWYKRQKHNLYVTIKSASIDPMRLIQSLAPRRASAVVRARESSSELSGQRMNRSRDSFRQRLASFRNSVSSRSSMNSFSSSMTSHTIEQTYGAECDFGEIESIDQTSSHGQGKFENRASIEISARKDDGLDCSEPYFIVNCVENSNVPYHQFPGRASFYGIAPSFLSSDHLTNTNSTNEDAIQFILSVDFNGREYTATRTLPAFIQLRHDLIREISASSLACGLFDDGSLSSDEQSPDQKPNGRSLVPELPLGNTGGSVLDDLESNAVANVGFSGRGFTRLHAIMASYCPVMEEWLRTVTEIVPDSPSLHNFLWEPLTSETPMTSILPKDNVLVKQGGIETNASIPVLSRKLNSIHLRNSLRSSIGTLGSIGESLTDDEEEK